MATRNVGRGLAKVFGIKLEDNPLQDKVTRGESVFSLSSADDYIEEEPTVAEYFRGFAPSVGAVLAYIKTLFPFINWLPRYNLQWLYGDLVAGITVGAVVVPQGMAYAKLAKLPVEYGLYSSFMGVLTYWIFATSKDITIGPVAVLSTVVGNVVLKAEDELPDVPGHIIASALSIITGAIVCFIGFARLGWLVDFVSLTSISAFMTGSAINIAVTQLPALMGIKTVSNRESPYKVIINTLKHLDDSKIDAAIGLSALAFLYIIRGTCNALAKHHQRKQKIYFFVSTLRSSFVILLYTMVSWLVNRNRRKNPRFGILGTVPRGFQHVAVPTVNKDIISAFAAELPATVIVMLLEHISISKSFGRINNYSINPSQEIVAMGVTNVLGPFLGAYPATGSFSRTAIKSKAGVRTPFAGVITALAVLLAIYALPAVFFYIPNAALAGVIIHAVGDLITPPNTVYKFWRISPLEVPIFFAGVIVTIFSNIENGIYTTIGLSAAVLLYRLFKARGRFLGPVKIHSVVGDHLTENEDRKKDYGTLTRSPPSDANEKAAVRNAFLPIDHHDGSNPAIDLNTPYPGVFIYRFSEGYNYPNASHYLDYMVRIILDKTRRTNPSNYGTKRGDRPWNDPGPRNLSAPIQPDPRPTLKAIILDFSSVNNVDITSVQHLIDVRNQLDRYAAPDVVEWHFASITNRWTKRALAAAGFGLPSPTPAHPRPEDNSAFHRWKPIFSVAEIGGWDSAANAAELELNREETIRRRGHLYHNHHHHNRRDGDVEAAMGVVADGQAKDGKEGEKEEVLERHAKVALVHGVNRPLFHVDLTSAVHSAVHNAKRKKGEGVPR